VADLPLEAIEPVVPTTMINLIGEIPDLTHLLSLPGVHLHLYGKEPRPGRKLGDVNVVGHQPETVAELRRLTGLD
jgi:5-(carboxyamino)imidazole ribonucleotide synthase